MASQFVMVGADGTVTVPAECVERLGLAPGAPVKVITTPAGAVVLCNASEEALQEELALWREAGLQALRTFAWDVEGL